MKFDAEMLRLIKEIGMSEDDAVFEITTADILNNADDLFVLIKDLQEQAAKLGMVVHYSNQKFHFIPPQENSLYVNDP